MLKSNTKKASENIRAYITDNFTPYNYTDNPPQEWNGIATFILDTFRSEKYHLTEDFQYYHNNEAAAFADWCAGLPCVLDTCYFYNRSAVDDLGAILEETVKEKARYSEAQAEKTLTSLIYRELKKGEAEAELLKVSGGLSNGEAAEAAKHDAAADDELNDDDFSL